MALEAGRGLPLHEVCSGQRHPCRDAATVGPQPREDLQVAARGVGEARSALELGHLGLGTALAIAEDAKVTQNLCDVGVVPPPGRSQHQRGTRGLEQAPQHGTRPPLDVDESGVRPRVQHAVDIEEDHALLRWRDCGSAGTRHSAAAPSGNKYQAAAPASLVPILLIILVVPLLLLLRHHLLSLVILLIIADGNRRHGSENLPACLIP
mmetsp:Transcript_110472/g.246495  ORF Transcript_110472/g.246495 Transcript_110472/m.246495 type:complete len:208 (+) Transcript_110472:194-817(+)